MKTPKIRIQPYLTLPVAGRIVILAEKEGFSTANMPVQTLGKHFFGLDQEG